ncbi:MAG: biopolymer transporter ExbD [Burkholderiales bacterium]|nr:biopolymer transporter ExbD [Burkholderiales bacterium]
MDFRRGIRRDEPEINFIPLIDLLLVILIFLMVTSRFTELQVNLPTAGADRPSERPVEIVVAVSAGGRYLVDNRTVAFAGAAGFAQALRQAAAGRDDATLVIHADAGASHQSVVDVLEAARIAGLARVTFAAQAPASGQR